MMKEIIMPYLILNIIIIFNHEIYYFIDDVTNLFRSSVKYITYKNNPD